jgi:hypothetical protein
LTGRRRRTRTTGGERPNTPAYVAKKNVGRNSVRCNACQLWIHVECGGISKEVFNILANPNKYGLGIVWNCDSCQASAARLDARMQALEGRFQEVENRVIRSEGIVQDATRRVFTYLFTCPLVLHGPRGPLREHPCDVIHVVACVAICISIMTRDDCNTVIKSSPP